MMAQDYAKAPAAGRQEGAGPDGPPARMTLSEGQVSSLVEENRRLREMVRRMDATNAFRRLDYLFKAVSAQSVFGPDFIARCVEEIEVALSIPEAEGDGGGTVGEGE